MRAGDMIKASVMARPADHLIAWVIEFPATGLRVSHSTWPGMPSLPSDLTRSRPDHVPRLSREARARATVLGYCDGQRTVRDIEQAVLHDHPRSLSVVGGDHPLRRTDAGRGHRVVAELAMAEARVQPPRPAPFHSWNLPDGAPWTQFYREATAICCAFRTWRISKCPRMPGA